MATEVLSYRPIYPIPYKLFFFPGLLKPKYQELKISVQIRMATTFYLGLPPSLPKFYQVLERN